MDKHQRENRRQAEQQFRRSLQELGNFLAPEISDPAILPVDVALEEAAEDIAAFMANHPPQPEPPLPPPPHRPHQPEASS